MRSTAGANFPATELPVIGRQLTAAVWWTAVVLLAALAALLLIRRLAGAFVEPLGGWQLIGTTLFVVAATALIQCSARGERFAFIVTAVASAIGLAALTLPGTAPWSASLSWFGLALAQAATLLVQLRRTRLERGPAIPATAIEEATDERISEQLVQQITRERNGAGGESLHALIRVPCPIGDRLAVVHLAFCPPLDAMLKLTAHALDDSGAKAKITLAEAYGTRIEVRWPHAASAGETILLEVVGE